MISCQPSRRLSYESRPLSVPGKHVRGQSRVSVDSDVELITPEQGVEDAVEISSDEEAIDFPVVRTYVDVLTHRPEFLTDFSLLLRGLLY